MFPPKRCLHIVRSRASSFKGEYPLLSLRSSSSFLRILRRLLPRLLPTSISPFIFPSITCFRRQFLRKMCPIQLVFLFLISCRIFLCSLTLSNISSFLTWSVQLIFNINTQIEKMSGSSIFRPYTEIQREICNALDYAILVPIIFYNTTNTYIHSFIHCHCFAVLTITVVPHSCAVPVACF